MVVSYETFHRYEKILSLLKLLVNAVQIGKYTEYLAEMLHRHKHHCGNGWKSTLYYALKCFQCYSCFKKLSKNASLVDVLYSVPTNFMLFVEMAFIVPHFSNWYILPALLLSM